MSMPLTIAIRNVKYLFVICSTFLYSQEQESAGRPRPEFEVASVKPSQSPEVGGVYTLPEAESHSADAHLQYLIEQAFNMQSFQVSGGPSWIHDERYDIEAKPPASAKSSTSMPPYAKAPPNDEQRQMLRSLLIERFRLKYRREIRQGPCTCC